MLKEGGYLVYIERYENKAHYRAMLKACEDEGLHFMEETRREIICAEGDRKGIFQCTVFQTGGKENG
ncbi:MAG: hypothetical protein IKD69_12320 [Solobacterium sp.]|nr:hypothetical protein [Solobacterium sp.]